MPITSCCEYDIEIKGIIFPTLPKYWNNRTGIRSLVQKYIATCNSPGWSAGESLTVFRRKDDIDITGRSCWFAAGKKVDWLTGMGHWSERSDWKTGYWMQNAFSIFRRYRFYLSCKAKSCKTKCIAAKIAMYHQKRIKKLISGRYRDSHDKHQILHNLSRIICFTGFIPITQVSEFFSIYFYFFGDLLNGK